MYFPYITHPVTVPVLRGGHDPQHRPVLLADIELRTGRPMRSYCWFDPPANPGSTLLTHKQPDDIWRLDYQLRPDEDPAEAVKPENVMPRVRGHLRMIGESDDVRPVWSPPTTSGRTRPQQGRACKLRCVTI